MRVSNKMYKIKMIWTLKYNEVTIHQNRVNSLNSKVKGLKISRMLQEVILLYTNNKSLDRNSMDFEGKNI